MKRVVFTIAIAALCCMIANAQSFKVGEVKPLAGAAAFTRAPALNDGSVHRAPPYFGHATIDVNTWQPVPGGASRATPLYDDTVNPSGFYFNQTLANVTGDDIRLSTGADNIDEITLSIVNSSTGALLTSDFTLDVRDTADPTIIYCHHLGNIDWQVVFGTGGLPAGYWGGVTFTGLACTPVPQAVDIGWAMTNITGGMNQGGQMLMDPVSLGSSQDYFWEDAAGTINYWWFGGAPRANIYYKVDGTPTALTPDAYSNITNGTGWGFGDALGPNGPVILDDLLMTKPGTVTDVEFSLFNTSAVTLMKVDVDIVVREWDVNTSAYTANLYVVTGTIDMTGFGGLPQYYWADVTTDLTGLGVTVATNDVMLGLKYYNPSPANSKNMGQVMYAPATIGWSDNVFRLEGSPTYGDGWYWFGGTPYAAMFWRVGIASGCKGDMNCDGLIDFNDIDPFVAILSGGTPCSLYNADVDGNGSVGFEDIDPFVALLSSGATCP